MANTFLNLEGLSHYDSKLKTVVGGSIEINGRVVKLKSVSGADLGSVTIPQTIYDNASATQDGLLTSEGFIKLEGIAEGATKVEASGTNGQILINGQAVNVYQHPTSSALTSGLYKITVDGSGHVTAGAAVKKADITALGIPAQDTTYDLATGSANGLMSSAHYTKVEGIQNGAQVNVLEKVSVNGSALAISSKGVNIDLSNYALKSDIASAVEYKGSVDSYSKLPASPGTGDMYNVVQADATHGIDAGTNVVWNGSAWDPMAPMVTFNGISNAEIDALFA